MKKGVAVTAIAQAAGVRRQAVYAWESGDSKSLKGSNLIAVARVLDVSPEWLDTGKGVEGTFREDSSPTLENLADLTEEALRLARLWMQISPARRTQFLNDMMWAEFFERKFPAYRIGVSNRASHDQFERSVEADWDRMMRQGRLPIEE